VVLIVDDEVQIRRFLRTGFELNGYSVHEAGTGTEAIRLATLQPIDLVITDLALPDIDGAEIVERIR
jgi:two-component system KDP operon response regulator KdpE